MSENPNSGKPTKRASLRRDSRPAARAKRDNLRIRRSEQKTRTKARRSSKM
ncbi:MAG: hypothetical protein HYY18_14305 [Planctomycetes bacterium]|nr:hypothetical protein [Planctomycetota bacterium]